MAVDALHKSNVAPSPSRLSDRNRRQHHPGLSLAPVATKEAGSHDKGEGPRRTSNSSPHGLDVRFKGWESSSASRAESSERVVHEWCPSDQPARPQGSSDIGSPMQHSPGSPAARAIAILDSAIQDLDCAVNFIDYGAGASTGLFIG